MLQTILAYQFTKTKFFELESLFAKILIHRVRGGMKPEEIQEACNQIEGIKNLFLANSTTRLGAMYKAGIITGALTALHLLKNEFSIQPK